MPALAAAGMFGLMAVFYLLMLLVETWLSLGLLASRDTTKSPGTGTTQNNASQLGAL